MIRHIVRKDWKLLWPMVVLVAAIQFALEWAVHRVGLFGEDAAAAALIRPLTLAWYVGIAALAAAAIHDPIPGVDQDWLIRPLRRSHLLLAKLLFVAGAVCVPMLIANLADACATGFPLLVSLEAASYKELYVFACLIVPVMALAALTRNMTELVILGAALVVAFSLSVSVSAFVLGPAWCPTCNSGVSWLQHALQHAGVLAGSVGLLGVQYYRRRTAWARALCVSGVVLFVLLQLPWKMAFSLEQRFSLGAAPAQQVSIEVAAPQAASAQGEQVEESGRAPADQRLVLGTSPRNVNQAVQYFRRRTKTQDASVTLDVPLRVGGVAPDELLLADRTELRLLGSAGRVCPRRYRGRIGRPAHQLPGPARRARRHPAPALGRAGRRDPPIARRCGGPSRLFVDAHDIATHRLAALNGEFESQDAGRCAVTNDRKMVYLRCKTIAQRPFCYSAVLVGADEVRNPAVLKCTPDYRRHVPAFTDVLGFYGVDLPLQDRNGAPYPIDTGRLGRSTVMFTVYEERAHFTRALFDAPAAALPAWRLASD